MIRLVHHQTINSWVLFPGFGLCSPVSAQLRGTSLRVKPAWEALDIVMIWWQACSVGLLRGCCSSMSWSRDSRDTISIALHSWNAWICLTCWYERSSCTTAACSVALLRACSLHQALGWIVIVVSSLEAVTLTMVKRRWCLSIRSRLRDDHRMVSWPRAFIVLATYTILGRFKLA